MHACDLQPDVHVLAVRTDRSTQLQSSQVHVKVCNTATGILFLSIISAENDAFYLLLFLNYYYFLK